MRVSQMERTPNIWVLENIKPGMAIGIKVDNWCLHCEIDAHEGYCRLSAASFAIWASVKLGDTLRMLIWRETINGILCCFGGNTDK